MVKFGQVSLLNLSELGYGNIVVWGKERPNLIARVQRVVVLINKLITYKDLIVRESVM